MTPPKVEAHLTRVENCFAVRWGGGPDAKSPKAHRTFGDSRLIEGQASRCAIRIDAAAKTTAA